MSSPTSWLATPRRQSTQMTQIWENETEETGITDFSYFTYSNPSALTWQIRRHLLKHCHRSMNHLEFLAPATLWVSSYQVPPVPPCIAMQSSSDEPAASSCGWKLILWCRLGEAKVYLILLPRSVTSSRQHGASSPCWSFQLLWL